jgi:hypothetical protein
VALLRAHIFTGMWLSFGPGTIANFADLKVAAQN